MRACCIQNLLRDHELVIARRNYCLDFFWGGENLKFEILMKVTVTANLLHTCLCSCKHANAGQWLCRERREGERVVVLLCCCRSLASCRPQPPQPRSRSRDHFASHIVVETSVASPRSRATSAPRARARNKYCQGQGYETCWCS
jgi:hypothetical protein